ncbi:MAG: DnaJ domain-containing protein [bacterium]|nr:DnaJ domain-containing protein [bacterium]
MTTYYDVLQIDCDATRDGIKSAFRLKAKECHPDLQPQERRAWGHARMHEILRAYEVLIDDRKRADYDRTIGRAALRASSLRESLRRRPHETAACCRLIFLDLLNGRGAEALALYERMRAARRPFDLAPHMEDGERLDCEFLLAEEYERQGRDEAAFRHYARVHADDAAVRHFGHFREEILLRLRNLVVRLLREGGNLPLALRGFADPLRGELPRRERAFLYKKIADCFLRMGEERLARLNLLAALLLHPGLGGTKKLRARLRWGRPALTA